MRKYQIETIKGLLQSISQVEAEINRLETDPKYIGLIVDKQWYRPKRVNELTCFKNNTLYPELEKQLRSILNNSEYKLKKVA